MILHIGGPIAKVHPYNDSNLLFNNTYHNSPNPTFELFDSSYDFPFSPIFEFYDPSHNSSDLFLRDFEIYNETQIENDMIDIIVHSANETIVEYDGNIGHNHEEYDDHNSKYKKKEENELKLHEGIMEFET
ncbi:hypothetical protein RhiirA4_462728 [Rhizophagus irregularis]|uniref:Uncharacterized protein n=1 Tax=Rhizophagus irregularis TaxID=588596 RepID=A0A2I1GLK0_9GLOM|nr:hypothetical protein RhiirA4_462728 [Rhizophagus irregularis]